MLQALSYNSYAYVQDSSAESVLLKELLYFLPWVKVTFGGLICVYSSFCDRSFYINVNCSIVVIIIISIGICEEVKRKQDKYIHLLDFVKLSFSEQKHAGTDHVSGPK